MTSNKSGGTPLVWTDLYGAAHALWTGLPGGHRWLLVCPPAEAQAVIHQLPDTFKGELYLLVTPHLTPLEVALREWTPAGLLVVGQALEGGPAVEVENHTVQAEGLSFTEGGHFPAWTSALAVQASQGECAPASLAAGLGVPVVSVPAVEVEATLRRWWARIPHAELPQVQQRQAVQR